MTSGQRLSTRSPDRINVGRVASSGVRLSLQDVALKLYGLRVTTHGSFAAWRRVALL
jgi:hypothetical protein